MRKIQCPCCGYYTIEDCGEEVLVDICPVCFWQYDWIAQKYPDKAIGPNHGVSLNEARINYQRFAAICIDVKEYVRDPLPDEFSESGSCFDIPCNELKNM